MEIEGLSGYDHYYDPEGARLHFCVRRRTIHLEGVKVILDKLPYLINEITNKIYFTTPAIKIIHDHVSKALANGRQITRINQFLRFNRGKFEVAKNTSFQYSAAEHFFIPGLIRSIPSDGYLTPVYFDKNVLIKFEHAHGYELDRQADSAGRIGKRGEYDIPFGINRSGNVIMWLGDLADLPSRDLMYLYSENIAPQYDLHSEFYRNQILGVWLD